MRFSIRAAMGSFGALFGSSVYAICTSISRGGDRGAVRSQRGNCLESGAGWLRDSGARGPFASGLADSHSELDGHLIRIGR